MHEKSSSENATTHSLPRNQPSCHTLGIADKHSRTSFLHYILLGIILLFSGYLIFKNLGDASLWVDEAETAIIAKNFLKTGHFTGWDGRNLFALRNGACLKKDLHDANPPLQFLLTALSFSLFGENNFSARLPFAIIGLLTVMLLYFFLRTELPERPVIALYAAAFLGLFIEYILYTRNCRYYSIACFAALFAFFAYRNFIRHPGMKSALGLAASAVLLYYSHYQICIAFLIPLAAVYLFIDRKHIPLKHWPQLLFVCFLFTLATLPYTIAYRLWERPDLPNIQFLNRFTVVWWFLKDSLGTGIAPWSILAASAIFMVIRRYDGKTRHIAKSALLIIIAHIVLIAFTTLQDVPEKFPVANIRYLAACFPFTAILAALVLYQIHQKNRLLAFAVALILISSNLSYILPGQNQKYKFKHPLVYSPLCKYLQEIHQPYPTATSAVTAFLKSNAKQDETYYAIPEYTNDPLKFYLGSRLINCCVLRRDTHLGADRMKLLSPYLLIEENFPDWLVFFGKIKIKTAQNSLQYFSRSFCRQDPPGMPFHYDYALVKNLAVYWGQSNRPEIFLHHFGEVRYFLPEKGVFIYRKIKDEPADWLLHFPQILSGAQTWGERGMFIKTLGRFYEMYLHDSMLVTKYYSLKQVLDYFKQYIQLLLEDKNFADAEKTCRTVLQLEPIEGENHYTLAKSLFGEGQYDKAIAICATIIKAIPTIHLPYMLAAESYELKGESDKSIALLTNYLNVINHPKAKEEVQTMLERLKKVRQKNK